MDVAVPDSQRRARHDGSEPLPSELKHIAEAVDASRTMLELEDDWDREGSRGYAEATWKRATQFVSKHARWAWEKCGVRIDAPRIRPGPEGSIDLHWKTENYELLLNVPSNGEEPASFYGDDYGKFTIKGTLDPSAYNRGLLMWLARR